MKKLLIGLSLAVLPLLGIAKDDACKKDVTNYMESKAEILTSQGAGYGFGGVTLHTVKPLGKTVDGILAFHGVLNIGDSGLTLYYLLVNNKTCEILEDFEVWAGDYYEED